MVRLTSAFFVSAICGISMVHGQDLPLSNTRPDADGSFPKAEQASPNSSADANLAPFPPTPMEERTRQMRVIPAMPREEPAKNKGMVSLHELRNPLTEEKAQKLNAANQQLLAGNEAGLNRLMLALEDPACAGYANAMLGTEFLKRGEVERATEFLREAVRLLPGLESARSNLGYALALTGQRKDSITELRKALALKADDPRPNYVLGVLLLSEQSAKAEAEQKLRAATSAVPAARVALAVLKDRAGDFEGVQRELSSVDPEWKDSAIAFVHRAAAMPHPAEAFGFAHSDGD